MEGCILKNIWASQIGLDGDQEIKKTKSMVGREMRVDLGRGGGGRGNMIKIFKEPIKTKRNVLVVKIHFRE